MRLIKLLIPVLIIATFIACSDLFNRGNDGPELTMTTSKAGGETVVFNGDTLVFEPYGPHQGDTVDIGELPPFKFTTNSQNILINGYYYAPSGPWEPEGIFQRDSNTITITVKKPEKTGPIHSLPTGWLYDASVTNLEKGSYAIHVIHQGDQLYYDNNSPLTTDLDTVFTKEFVVE